MFIYSRNVFTEILKFYVFQAEFCETFLKYNFLFQNHFSRIQYEKGNFAQYFDMLYHELILADTELIDLHIQLMRKIYLKSARADKWEQSLLKFCSICPSLESELLELERYNYVDLPLSVKLSVLKALCESQFDCNVKFKENVSNTF